jgi:YHS domain-containing protein
MQYTSKIGDRPAQAHVNYQCPCGCVAGLTYDRTAGAEHVGMCCCGRLLWVGADAVEVVRRNFKSDREYDVDESVVVLPWGDRQPAALAVPLDALAQEQAKRDSGETLTKVTDPVCKMMFEPEAAAATTRFQGTRYYFCTERCKARFDSNPRQYVPGKTLLSRLLGR